MTARSFPEALASDRPAADRADKMKLYGWLIGRWTMAARVHLDNGGTHQGLGEIHFGWVLEGRAIQDVWILPGVFHGTTLRVYNPAIDAWHILWSDPLRQFYTRQIGRAQGRDIVQLGKNDAGDAVRWSFTEINAGLVSLARRALARRRQELAAAGRISGAPRAIASRYVHPKEQIMIDHISIGVRDIARTKRFYDAVLKPLGYTCLSESQGSLGYGQDAVALWISGTDRPVPADLKSGLHLCFVAPTSRGVEAFHAAALSNGGRDNGTPGLRADYGPDYYAAFVIDPDGYRLEAHCNRSAP
jgi:catechol 2,3-dioxygenase-like lactoylglutathione lyase family enzyme